MGTRPPRSSIGAIGRRPELPAFCRTRRRTVIVEICRLRRLERLLVLVLLFQLSTLLLVIAWPFSPQPQVRGPKGVVPVLTQQGFPISAAPSAQAFIGVAGSSLPADPKIQRHLGSW